MWTAAATGSGRWSKEPARNSERRSDGNRKNNALYARVQKVDEKLPLRGSELTPARSLGNVYTCGKVGVPLVRESGCPLTCVCGSCGRVIEAWSDGNPYYLDRDGQKHYAYHPNHERLDRCIGNDLPHLCLACGEKFNVDSLAPIKACPKCGSADIVRTYELDGQRCPYCKAGIFTVDPDYDCIS
jgi:predicted RNA-binding Zn-ribbon protein involved in translation (DUF1610 family)